MFYPKSVAVVGATANPRGWGGTSFLMNLRRSGFKGELYAVNRTGEDVNGIKGFSNMRLIPKPVDYVIIAIPAPGVPGVLEDCVAAGVKNVHIFTSGFNETGEAEGRQLDKEILEIIQKGGLQVVGPNCMGLWVPASKLTPWGARPKGAGSLAFVSQSGGHGEILTTYAQSFGVYFSKIVSFGNAKGLQAVDYLEYLKDDPDTKIISIYLEGLKNGNRITQLIREINRTKPVIIWKGGLTDSGSRAVASHTGSLAGEGRIWDGFFSQTGAIRVYSLEEIIDVALAFMYLPRPNGRNALLLGGGGGNSVAYADVCSREGLVVPPLSDATRQELNTFIRLAGNSTRNPLDIWEVHSDSRQFRRSIELTLADPAIDMAIVDRMVGEFFEDDIDDANTEEKKHAEEHKKRNREINDFLIEFSKANPFKKPMVITLNMYGGDLYSAPLAAELRKYFCQAGLPAYPSPVDAARALSRYVQYYEYQRKEF